MTIEERLVLSDKGVYGLLNGRDRQERIDSMMARLTRMTEDVNNRCNVELVLKITCPSTGDDNSY